MFRETMSAPRMSMSALNQTDDPDRQVRIWLLSSLDVKGTTYYRVAGRFTTSGQTWQVNRRYSEFLMLRDTLVKFFSRSTDTCPGCLNYLHAIEQFDFPKKHLFVSKSSLVVNYRVKALRMFLNLLASWAFSNAPKCPTCGGFAFDIVRNFVLEGADPVGDSSLGYIRDSFVVSTFTDPVRRSSIVRPTLERRDSFIPASGSATLLAAQRKTQQPNQSQQAQQQLQQQQQRRSELHRRNTMEARSADSAYETFNDYLPPQPSHAAKANMSRSTINIPLRQEEEEEDVRVAHARTAAQRPSAIHRANSSPSVVASAHAAPIHRGNSVERGLVASTSGQQRETTGVKNASQTGSFLFYQDGVERGSTTSGSSRASVPKRGILKTNRDTRRGRDRVQNDSYISLEASQTSIEADNYRMAGEQYHSHHPSVLSSPQSAVYEKPPPSTQRYVGPSKPKQSAYVAHPASSHLPDESFVSDSFVDDSIRFDGMQVDVADVSDSDDDEIDITGVVFEAPQLQRRKSTSAEGLWQPWELAKAG